MVVGVSVAPLGGGPLKRWFGTLNLWGAAPAWVLHAGNLPTFPGCSDLNSRSPHANFAAGAGMYLVSRISEFDQGHGTLGGVGWSSGLHRPGCAGTWRVVRSVRVGLATRDVTAFVGGSPRHLSGTWYRSARVRTALEQAEGWPWCPPFPFPGAQRCGLQVITCVAQCWRSVVPRRGASVVSLPPFHLVHLRSGCHPIWPPQYPAPSCGALSVFTPWLSCDLTRGRLRRRRLHQGCFPALLAMPWRRAYLVLGRLV